jgi:uncharacterized protein
MESRFKNSKIIFDPLWGIVDITDYLPLVDVPQFQALGFKYQLGVTNTLYPSATHTRKQHCFGSFRRTQDLATRWMEHGFINKTEAKTLAAFALWHDIGHGPFSHVVEDVTEEIYGRDHDANGIYIVDHLKDAVTKAGLDFDSFRQFFTHANPLYKAVHDKNLGTEKLDYLSRDAYYTIGEIPGVEFLAHHTLFIDGRVMIDEKAMDQAKSIQEFYVKMFKNVYLRKSSAIAQRLVQKMTAELLRVNPLAEENFWALTDFGLLGLLETSENPAVKEYYQRFMRRDLPKTAISLRTEKFHLIDQKTGKAVASLAITEDEMNDIISFKNFAKPSQLELAEEEVARIAKLPPHSITIVPPFHLERFVPQDIAVYLSSGATGSLREYFADHFHALEEEGRSYIVMRICTYEEYREKLSRPATAAAVKDYILSLVNCRVAQ